MKYIVSFLMLFGIAYVLTAPVMAGKSCEACYQGMRRCSYDPECADSRYPLGSCSAYGSYVVWPSDTWETCGGTPVTQCGVLEVACNVNSQPGYCCSAAPTPTTKPSTPGCTPNCSGAYCGYKDNECGGNCTCNVCTSTCTPACGQTGDCGSTCPATDAGAPSAPTLVAPGTVGAPGPIVSGPTVNLRWGVVAKAESVVYQVFDVSNMATAERSGTVNGVGSTGVVTATLTPGAKAWRAYAVNDTCGLQGSAWSSWQYFQVNGSPTAGFMTTKSVAGNVNVPFDPASGNRTHICVSTFVNSTQPRNVKFEAQVSDPDGSDDLQNVAMIWNGVSYPMTLGPVGAAVGATASVTIPFNGTYPTSALPISISLTDSTGLGSTVATIYSFKAWDCNVDVVTSRLYDDATNNANCFSGTGFSSLATTMNLSSVGFNKIAPAPSELTTFNASNINTYSGGSIKFSPTYQINLNSDFNGTVSQYRWIDVGVGTTSCGQSLTLNQNVVDPYQADPRVQVDFSAAKNQEAWFQVLGGGIQASSGIANMVPQTCRLYAGCVSSMTNEDGSGEANNGLVSSSGSISNNSGCALGNGANDCKYGTPNNWRINQSIISSNDKLNYQFFYDRYFVNMGAGKTYTSSTTMSTIGVGATGVILVNGDLNINANNTLLANEFLMVVVKGDITIDQSVTSVSGILMADGDILVGGTNNTALNINGIVYGSQSGKTVRMSRSFTNKALNNSTPAVTVNYDPGLLFNLPGNLQTLLQGWREY